MNVNRLYFIVNLFVTMYIFLALTKFICTWLYLPDKQHFNCDYPGLFAIYISCDIIIHHMNISCCECTYRKLHCNIWAATCPNHLIGR